MQGLEPATGGVACAAVPHAHADWLTALAIWCFTGLLAALGFSFGFYYLNRAGYGVPAESDILDAVAIFDGRWYRQIAVDGYFYDPERRSNVAFFPVYPLLARGLIWLTGLRAEAALLVVSNLSLLFALWLLARYTRARWPEADTNLVGCVVLAAAIFPTGCFFRLAYSESTFLLLSILAMLGMARNWPVWRTALIIGLATAARPVGIALLAPLAIHVCRQSSRGNGLFAVSSPVGNGLRAVPPAAQRRAAMSLVHLAIYIPLACWGLAAYIAYQRFAFGDALAFARIQRRWGVMPELAWPEKLRALATLSPVWSVYDSTTSAFWGTSDSHGIAWFSLLFANPFILGAVIALLAFGAWRRWLSSEELVYCGLLLFIPYVTRGYEMGMRVDQASQDAELAEGFQRGAEAALREVLRDFWPRLTCVLGRKYAVLVPWEDVRDLVHAAIEHGWRRHGRFDPARGTLIGWLYVIADHEVADFA